MTYRNEERNNAYSSASFTKRMTWTGCVQRMGEIINARGTFSWKFEVIRPLGRRRPGAGGKYDVKTNFPEISIGM